MSVKPNPRLKFDPIAFLAKAGEGRAATGYAGGQVIFAQGDPADAVFYVQTGRVKLTSRQNDCALLHRKHFTRAVTLVL